MAYLKALGILRLVSEKDTEARGWWHDDSFWLRAKVLFTGKNNDEEKRNALVQFFLHDYRPTPLVAPWNAGSGFYLKWDENRSTFKSCWMPTRELQSSQVRHRPSSRSRMCGASFKSTRGFNCP